MTNKSETLSFRVPDSLYRQVYDIAKKDRRKLSEVALGLLERGLAAYLRDGSIFENVNSTAENRSAVDISDELNIDVGIVTCVLAGLTTGIDPQTVRDILAAARQNADKVTPINNKIANG